MNLDTAPTVANADLPPTLMRSLDLQRGLILLGRDERSRPHASAFGPDEVLAAECAATLMGFATLIVAEEHQALASSLPKGRIFESGKAFVPFCSTQTFARLLEAAGLPDAPAPARAAAKPAEPSPPPAGSQGGGAPAGGAGGAAKPPFDWADIAIGSLVLAQSVNRRPKGTQDRRPKRTHHPPRMTDNAEADAAQPVGSAERHRPRVHHDSQNINPIQHYRPQSIQAAYSLLIALSVLYSASCRAHDLQ